MIPFDKSSDWISEYEHGDTVSCVRLDSSERLLVSGARDGSVVFWSYQKKKLHVLSKKFDFESEITDICITYDSHLCAVSSKQGKVLVYNLANSSKIKTFYHPKSHAVTNVILSLYPIASLLMYSDADKTLLSYSINGQLLKKTTLKSEAISIEIGHDQNHLDFIVNFFLLDPDNLKIFSCVDGTVQIANLPFLDNHNILQSSEHS